MLRVYIGKVKVFLRLGRSDYKCFSETSIPGWIRVLIHEPMKMSHNRRDLKGQHSSSESEVAVRTKTGDEKIVIVCE